MKYLIIILTSLLLVTGYSAQGQRYIPRQVGIQLSAGPVDGILFRNKYGERLFHCGLALSRYNENRTRWVAGVDFLQKEYRYRSEKIPVSEFTAQGGYFVPFLSNRSMDVVVSFGLSALAGYESVN